MPAPWKPIATKLQQSKNLFVQVETLGLSVTFGDANAWKTTRGLALNTKENLNQRKAALLSLVGAKDTELVPTLHRLLSEKPMRQLALRGLAEYDDPNTGTLIIALYSQLNHLEKQTALSTLSSRVQYADQMLTAIANKIIPATDLSAAAVTQMTHLSNKAINAKIMKVWGTVKESPADKKQLIKKYKHFVASIYPRTDIFLGRAVFQKTCAGCHKLFDTGGNIGPELTGSHRANLDYLLSNVVDPSAVMAKAYQPLIIETTSGRVITGLLKEESTQAITLQTAEAVVVIPKNEIDVRKQSNKSMMPDGLWKNLSRHEIRSLIKYLASPKQVPLKATKDNVQTFFNGKNLLGWQGDKKLWSVKKGEIVGRSTGLKQNAFLINNMLVGDFDLKLSVKLTPNAGNSGIQFRSKPIAHGQMKGYQADIGKGWWGKLYEEHGRKLLWKKSGEEFVKEGEWNKYHIRAKGDHIQTWINGKLCVDLKDPDGAKAGRFALQIHSGGAMEVRFKEIKLELITK